MATQFYFKREWLKEVIQQMIDKYSNWSAQVGYAQQIRFHFGKTDANGICTINSDFVFPFCINRPYLEEVLTPLGFYIVDIEQIAHNQTKIKILPFPYDDPRCRAKELPIKKTL